MRKPINNRVGGTRVRIPTYVKRFSLAVIDAAVAGLLFDAGRAWSVGPAVVLSMLACVHTMSGIGQLFDYYTYE